MGFVWVYMQKMELCWEYGDEKTKNKLLFLSFAAFRTAKVWGKTANYHMLFRVIREIKVSRD